MQRKTALLIAGCLTIMVTASALWLTKQVNANATNQAAVKTLAPIQAVEDNPAKQAENNLADLEVAYKQRDAALQAQVAKGQVALQSLDKTYQDQLKLLQDQVAALETQVNDQAGPLQSLQDQIAQGQGLTRQDDIAYRQQLAALQQRDAQAQTQLQDSQAQLQAADATLTARQTTQAQATPTPNQSTDQQQSDSSSHKHKHKHSDD